MADTKISALTASTTPLVGTEVLPIVQSGSTKQVSVANLTAGRNVAMAQALTTSHVGVNVTPSAWQSTYKAVEINKAGNSIFGWSGGGLIGCVTGAYIDSGYTWRYAIAGQAINKIELTETGVLTFSRAPAGTSIGDAVTWSVMGRFDTSSNYTFNVGNLVQGTAAKGINFTANTPAAGMTSQLLNWYEEGTCSLAISDGTNSSATQTMKYVRTGRQVTVTVALYAVNVTGLTAGAALRVTGFPFNASGQMDFVLFQPKIGGILAEIPNGNTYAGLYATNTAQDGAAISVTSLGGPSTMSLFGAATYQV